MIHCHRLLVAALITFASTERAALGGLPEQAYSRAAGAPRPWQQALNATRFSNINMCTGNVLTELELFAWEGRVPFRLALFHNSLTATSTATAPAGAGFTLGPGWRVSYGGQIVQDGPHHAYVIGDDGRTDKFTLQGQTWTAPPGVYDVLSLNAQTGWTLVRKNQSYRRFDLAGHLTRVGDATGNELHIHYDDDRLDRIVDDAHRRGVTFSYDDPNRTITIRDSVNRAWVLHMDATGRMIRIDYPKPASVGQRHVQIDYDAAGRIVRVLDFAGTAATIAYADEYPLSVTDPIPAGQPYVQRFDFSALLTSALVVHTTYTDRRGLPWTWEVKRDDSAHILSRSDPHLNVESFARDGHFNVLTYTNPKARASTYTYDEHGNLLTATNPLSKTWTYRYDEPGRNAASGTLHNLTSVTNPLGTTVDLYYDDARNKTSVTRIVEPATEPGGPQAVTLLSYYYGDQCPGGGNLWNGLLRSVQDPNGVKTFFRYDEHGQRHRTMEGTNIVAPCDTSPDIQPITVVENFDAAGRFQGVEGNGGCSWWVWEDPLWCTSTRCPAVQTCAVFGLDELPTPHIPGGVPSAPFGVPPGGNTTWARDPNGVITAALGVLDSLPLIADQSGIVRTLTFGFDALYRPLSRSIESNDNRSGQSITRAFNYVTDPDGRVLSRTGPGGVTQTYDYDDAGRPRTIAQDNLSASYLYDAAGDVRRITYGNGVRAEFTYDQAERLEAIAYDRLAGYDTNGNPLFVTLQTLTHKYDAAGRMIQRSILSHHDGDVCLSLDFTYDYDVRGRLTAEACRATSLGCAAPAGYADYRAEYAYDLGGNRLTKTRKDGGGAVQDVTNYSYDVQFVGDPGHFRSFANRLMFYEVRKPTGELIRRVDYAYNAGGQPRYIVTTLPGDEWRYGLGLSYTKGGQLWLAIQDKWRLNESQERIDHTRLAATQYLADGVGIARWLVRGFDPNQARPNTTHDPNNPSTWRVLGEVLRDFDGDERVGDYAISATPPPGTPDVTPLRYYVGDAGHIIAANGHRYHTHPDHLGSAVLTTGAHGQQAARMVHRAFGEPLASEWSTPEARTRYGWAGAWGYEAADADLPPGHDVLADEGYIHIGARYYDPATGRFLQRDPIGIAGGPIVYQYVASRPLSSVDPWGLRDPSLWKPHTRGIRETASLDDDAPFGRRPPPPNPTAAPAPRSDPAAELAHLRKQSKVFGMGAAIGVFAAGWICGGPIGGAIGAGVAAAGLIDEIRHWDEPQNPIY